MHRVDLLNFYSFIPVLVTDVISKPQWHVKGQTLYDCYKVIALLVRNGKQRTPYSTTKANWIQRFHFVQVIFSLKFGRVVPFSIVIISWQFKIISYPTEYLNHILGLKIQASSCRTLLTTLIQLPATIILFHSSDPFYFTRLSFNQLAQQFLTFCSISGHLPGTLWSVFGGTVAQHGHEKLICLMK